MNAAETAYVEELKHKNVLLEQENAGLAEQVKFLTEQLDWLKRQLFGKRSEKVVPDPNDPQLYLPGLEPAEHTPELAKRIPAHTRRTHKKGEDSISLPPNLPVETVIIDLPPEEKLCPKTGQPLVKIGEERTQKLAHKPGSYFIKVTIRPKYGLPNGEGVCTAALPDSILPRCRADESFLSDILVKKFADHLPLYRIAEGLGRQGIGISRQLLSQWVMGLGQELKPLYDEMTKQILVSGRVYADEVPIPLQAVGKTQQAYMWVIVGGKGSDPPHRVYHFRNDRRHQWARDLFKDYRGILHSDKYGAYQELAERKQIVWCPCWSHIRRKFFEAESGDLPFRDWVLRKIRYLFLFEHIAWSRSEEERLQIRAKHEVPIIDELIEAIKQRLVAGPILPKSKFKTALGYFCSLIPYLKNYTTDPHARLDNNVAERAVRPLVIGRKNWLFVGSPAGGEAAAVIFSLVQTCRSLKINPYVYLEDVMRRLPSHSTHRLAELLPDQWLAGHQHA